MWTQCDRCVSEARVTVEKDEKALLEFCGHHFAEHAEALTMAEWVVIRDDRDELLVKVTSGAMVDD